MKINETQTGNSPANRVSTRIRTNRGKILLVDDEPDVVFTLKLSLETHGYQVDGFKKPSLALQNFQPGLYDLLILDIKLPEMDGYELYRRIKEMDSRVKVCFVTAGEIYLEEYLRRVPESESGKTGFILKPVEIGRLLSTVESLIGADNSPEN